VMNISCFGYNDGSIELFINGGTSPYSYLWSNGNTTSQVTGLSSGSLTVTVTDSHNCTETETHWILEPPAITVTSSLLTPVTCNGGTDGAVDITVSGGIGTIIFSWSNNLHSEDISGVPAGIYFVTMTDLNGCEEIDSFEVIQSSAPIFTVLNDSAVLCFGGTSGSGEALVNGGTSPYSFIWSNGATTSLNTGLAQGNYSVTIVDALGCTDTAQMTVTQPSAALGVNSTGWSISCFGNQDGQAFAQAWGGTSPYQFLWSTGSTAEYLVNLSAMVYSLTITDANGCMVADSVLVNEPEMLVAYQVIQHVACFNDSTGFIDLTPSGGTPPYVFIWSDGFSGEDLSGVPAGLYSVTLTDVNDCMVSSTAEVLEPGSQLIMSLSHIDVSCYATNSGSITTVVTGGMPPYLYEWSNGDSSAVALALFEGAYAVTVTDSYGCKLSDTVTIGPSIPVLADVLVLTDYNGFPVSCATSSDGALSINITQGSPPYNITWNNFQTGTSLTNLATGIYTIFVLDNMGCRYLDTVILSAPDPLQADPIVIYPNCPGIANGLINLNLSGGVSPYGVTWSTTEMTEIISDIPAGFYEASVLDANGCPFYYSVNLINEYEECLFIPNAITPNGDGFNDDFRIRGIEFYPDVIVEIYNRWGQLMFKSGKGYHTRWDGTYNGKNLPIDNYFYVIDLNDGTEVLTGSVAIIR
jgi:gliding motility-associated-like protein